MKGGFSGGTAGSFLNAMRLRETDPNFDRLSRDPYALCPEGAQDGPDGPDRMMPLQVTWDADLQAWTKPYSVNVTRGGQWSNHRIPATALQGLRLVLTEGV